LFGHFKMLLITVEDLGVFLGYAGILLNKYFFTQDTVVSILSLLLAHFVLVFLFIGNFSLENLRKLFAKYVMKNIKLSKKAMLMLNLISIYLLYILKTLFH
jgi:hypothetical protein